MEWRNFDVFLGVWAVHWLAVSFLAVFGAWCASSENGAPLSGVGAFVACLLGMPLTCVPLVLLTCL